MNVVSNAKWIAFSQVARIASQAGNIFILSRFLPPADYGIMAMASVVTNLALLLRDQGTSAALIQKKEIAHSTINTVFWFNLILGLLIAVFIISFSNFFAIYFKEPKLSFVLSSLAITFPLGSSISAHQALLERDNKFKQLAFVEIGASVLAILVAILAAYFSAGVYSLVAQAVSASIVSVLSIWSISSWRPNGKPDISEFKSILPFTGHMTGFQVINYISRNADSLVVGRVLGSNLLGVYSMAYKIMLLPVQNITWAISRALYPVLSKKQDSLVEMRHLYNETIGAIAFITAPIMAVVYALREPFVHIAFGDQWYAVSDLLAWLTPVGFLQSISSASGTVFMALGKTKQLMLLSLLSAIVHIIGLCIGSNGGLIAIAQCYLIASIVMTIIYMYFTCNILRYRIAELFMYMWRPIISSIFFLIIVRYSSLNFHLVGLNSYLEFLVYILLSTFLYIAVLSFLMPKQLVRYFVAIVKK